jgi:hypothetical protein
MRVSREKKVVENHEEEIKIDDEDGSYKAGGAMSFKQDFSFPVVGERTFMYLLGK